MAATAFGTNDNSTVKLWARTLAVEVLKTTWAGKFMGTEDSAIIQVRDETTKQAGDKLTYALRMQLTGNGTIGDGLLDGNEEALTTYTDAVNINQLRHGVRMAGRMSQQRVPYDLRMEGLSGLRDWWASRLDLSFFNQICAFTPTLAENGVVLGAADTRFTGMQAVVAPDSNHIIRSDGSTGDDSVTTTSTFTLSLIDKCVERARTLTPAIRPTMVGGKPMYVMFLHPYQVTDMKNSTSTGGFLDIQKAAMTGGEVQDNPIFDGSLGVYNGVILHSDSRVTPGVNQTTSTTQVSAVRRAVFCGAQAAMCAYGRDGGPTQYTWVESLFDYENQVGVAAGTIFGLKKAVFNSTDFATVVVASYGASH